MRRLVYFIHVDMNNMYGFKGEVTQKYSASLFPYFTELFNALPLGYIIQDAVFVCHGGLGEGMKMSDLKDIKRFNQPKDTNMVSLLWSDPADAMGATPSKRGAGIGFGEDITSAFLKTHGLSLLIRSHEMKEAGYEIVHDGQCITVFSAPNYCDQMGNKGAVVQFSHEQRDGFGKYNGLYGWIEQFEAVAHPNVKAMAYAPQFQ